MWISQNPGNQWVKLESVMQTRIFFPMEVTLDDSSVSFNIDDVLPKWQSDFSSLFTGKDTNLNLGNVSGNVSSHTSKLLTRIPTVIPINK